MTTSKRKERPTMNITASEEIQEQVASYSYFGNIITSDGRTDTEIRKRTGMAKYIFGNM